MTLKEEIVCELDRFEEKDLKKVAGYLSFLKHHSRWNDRRDLSDDELASLYKEFAEEDRILAEEGMDDFARALKVEDNQ